MGYYLGAKQKTNLMDFKWQAKDSKHLRVPTM